MRICLPTGIAIVALTTAAYAVTLPPIPMHSGWVTFKNIEERDGFKVFRRYGFMGDANNPFQNLIMFNCSKDAKKAASHLTFVLPKEFQPESFARSTWLPKIDVRILIDDKLSVQMPGEYHAGEVYLDLNTETSDNFVKVMLADRLAIGFGDKNDIIQFQFTEKVDGIFSEYIREFGSQFGELTHYLRGGVGSVTESCNDYQNTMGPEWAVIILFSNVAALEVDCSFKGNRGELRKFARMQGFEIDDFLPNGRFSEQVHEKTNDFRGFIQKKGCKTARGIVRGSFPTFGK